MKKKIIRYISLVFSMLIFFSTISFAKVSFSDVRENDWFYNDIMELSDTGIINGYEDNSFRPYENITVAEFLKLLIVSTTGKTFEAKEGKHWAQGYYDYAVLHKIVYPKDFSELDFNKTLRREDMAGMLIGANYQIFKNKPEDIIGVEKSIVDFGEIKLIRRDDVLQLYKIGIIKGNGNGRFYPKGYSTRADVSTVLVRLKNKNNALN